MIDRFWSDRAFYRKRHEVPRDTYQFHSKSQQEQYEDLKNEDEVREL